MYRLNESMGKPKQKCNYCGHMQDYIETEIRCPKCFRKFNDSIREGK